MLTGWGVVAMAFAAGPDLGVTPNKIGRGASTVAKAGVWVDRTPVYWRTVSPDDVDMYLHRYFDRAHCRLKIVHADVFFVWEVPAAVMLYVDYTTKGNPVVHDLHMNKSLLLLSGMAAAMRSSLFDRYPNLSVPKDKFPTFYELP